MNYELAVQYLFDSAPMFQNVGAAAYKEGLGGTLALDERFGHPHSKYKTIHVGGTNGKGSVCHTLAAILQAQGYRVGLYTSPHLVDFRERIKVNGKMISKKRVVEFVHTMINSQQSMGNGTFSFFELATALAFQYFAEQRVDYAVIEVGLGGRLDCTNIIRPVLSVITNISIDHVQFLGDTLPKIAGEKAGIIKPGIPVCIGEDAGPQVKAVFADRAREVGAPIVFAEDIPSGIPLSSPSPMDESGKVYALRGLCQEKNRRTILTSVRLLREQGIRISDEAIERGFRDVITMTGLMGRWQTICERPLTICDTGHNAGGMQYIARQLQEMSPKRLHIVIGMVNDKDVDAVLSLLPKTCPERGREVFYYFTQASVKRAMPAEELARRAAALHLSGFPAFGDVASAYLAARQNAGQDDLIFIGGSTFVVADLLSASPSLLH